MAKLIATIKAVITRVLFGTHGFVAIWQVARNKENPIYWYLCIPIGLLFIEGLFTLAIKKNQEWRWFCPSVFLYLSSVVPAIWLLELDKIDRRLKFEQETGNLNLTALSADLKKLDKLLGVQIKLPDIQVDPSTWITLIEQFLMLILIVGRWMLPKGDLTRDQLSQLLLVYIGTAADIIEFFDSYKDNTIASEALLVFLTLGIWSWSLLQFTIVLSATRSRKPRGGGTSNQDEESNVCCGGCCCSIDVWGITLNIILQDAPFLAFRLLIIVHYKIISYMNVFFTCKNTLVILLQLYRLYVVHTENSKTNMKKKCMEQQKNYRKQNELNEMNQFNDIYIISSGKFDKKRSKRNAVSDISDDELPNNRQRKKCAKPQKSTHSAKQSSSAARKDTGYSTASSHTSKSNEEKNRAHSNRHVNKKHQQGHQECEAQKSKEKYKENEISRKRNKKHRRSDNDEINERKKRSSSEEINRKTRKTHHHTTQNSSNEKELVAFTEESDTSENSSQYKIVNEKRKRPEKNKKKLSISSSYTSDE